MGRPRKVRYCPGSRHRRLDEAVEVGRKANGSLLKTCGNPECFKEAAHMTRRDAMGPVTFR